MTPTESLLEQGRGRQRIACGSRESQGDPSELLENGDVLKAPPTPCDSPQGLGHGEKRVLTEALCVPLVTFRPAALDGRAGAVYVCGTELLPSVSRAVA